MGVKMRKYIILIILLILPISGSAKMSDMMHMMAAAGGSTVCSEDYAPSLTQDGSRDVCVYNNQEFNGFIYTPATDKCVCYVDLYLVSETGDLSAVSINYHVQIWTLGVSNVLSSLLGSSDAVASADLHGHPANWIGTTLGDGKGFPFSSCVSLSASTSYGFAIIPDTDADLTDDPEVDGTNYFSIGLDNENDGGLIHSGRVTWKYNSGTRDVNSTDPEDDILVKIGNEE